jgi:branched-chain amino acid transport system ATP-binding protein
MKILEVIGVTKRFGRVMALKDVSFTHFEGEILGVIGPNGAGKTTLVNLITGSLSYSNGDIRFGGGSIRDLKPHQIGQLGISRTFQVKPPLTKMSALENVMMGALFGRTERRRGGRAARRRAEEALDFLGLAGKKDIPIERLNGLERKRLEMAIAMAMNPKLLLLDEVMSGLNPTEIDVGVALIKEVRDTGVTILVIEHVMKAIAKVSDRVVVLHHGEKITEGPPEIVLNDRQVIDAYLGKRYKATAALSKTEKII